mmetsp:Transcript_11279/g.52402  ORF Transcript_11279/g.52402 Transcript_11279/m.52402 type:complete len:379 (+) Transcript_11279:515-1651(+)
MTWNPKGDVHSCHVASRKSPTACRPLGTVKCKISYPRQVDRIDEESSDQSILTTVLECPLHRARRTKSISGSSRPVPDAPGNARCVTTSCKLTHRSCPPAAMTFPSGENASAVIGPPPSRCVPIATGLPTSCLFPRTRPSNSRNTRTSPSLVPTARRKPSSSVAGAGENASAVALAGLGSQTHTVPRTSRAMASRTTILGESLAHAKTPSQCGCHATASAAPDWPRANGRGSAAGGNSPDSHAASSFSSSSMTAGSASSSPSHTSHRSPAEVTAAISSPAAATARTLGAGAATPEAPKLPEALPALFPKPTPEPFPPGTCEFEFAKNPRGVSRGIAASLPSVSARTIAQSSMTSHLRTKPPCAPVMISTPKPEGVPCT